MYDLNFESCAKIARGYFYLELWIAEVPVGYPSTDTIPSTYVVCVGEMRCDGVGCG